MIKMLLVKFHYLKIKYSKSIEKIKDYYGISNNKLVLNKKTYCNIIYIHILALE